MAQAYRRLRDAQAASSAAVDSVSIRSSMRRLLRPAVAAALTAPRRTHAAGAAACGPLAAHPEARQHQQRQKLPNWGAWPRAQLPLQQAHGQHHQHQQQRQQHGGPAGGAHPRRRCATAAAAHGVSTAQSEASADEQRQGDGGDGAAPGGGGGGAGGDPEGEEQRQAEAARAPRRAPRYSPLHHNVEDFCRQVVPTREERAAKQRVIEAVTACTRRGLEGLELPQGARVKVHPFGSFVSGLSTWNSDVDIVISGLVTPSRLTGGFAQADKRYVTRVLERVAKELRRARRLDLRSLVIIRTARIPIIKLQTGPAAGSVVADVSVGDGSGPAAARYVAQQIAAFPPLAPLVLVLKVYLRRCGLNEVAQGGLSSFSLTLMVLAHLQEEIKAGNDVFDLGEALYSFLLRYGEEFDYAGDAVSVASGGVVPKAALGAADYGSSSGSFDDGGGGGGGGGGGWGGGRERLMVDDPLTGRDVSAGTYRVDDLRIAFTRAARRLESLARKPAGPDTNYLQARPGGLFEVESALRRGPRDLHGQHFPEEGAGARAPRARRGGGGGGGGGGRGAPPREVIALEQPEEEWELDLGALEGDALLSEGGGRWRDDAKRGPGGGGGGGEEGGGQRRRRQRRS
ncbi:poly(a) polymerase [Raphidocelis subcapitata]|uniref:Poly(A) polymerase n=1 Tax=Raphidocelis subcapitata TaxID=307507 RepID=A0A2V0PJF4_9CHLO|nr:poly(a) polymerase [Raphidocelis subcapitata]|eukprot:GBF99928.1 poly(a) polymerase [Raphidocelis subcapitata]